MANSSGGESDLPFQDAVETHDIPPPLSFHQLDQLQYHIELKELGERLQNAANAAYPNDGGMRYTSVWVLVLYWDDEDPKLPVSIEADELASVLGTIYRFDVETYRIPSEGSHKKLNRKVLDFVEQGDDSRDDLKIVYYGGHGMLTNNRQPSWASRPSPQDPSYRTVKWSGIQNALEEAQSDVLLLLDCCASGTANTDNGHGITELISACSFNTSANPVGPDSFTSALITELRLLSRAPSFTVGVLYNKLLCRIQNRMPAGREMQKSPLHVVLTQNKRLPMGIQLSPHRAPPSKCETELPIKSLGSGDDHSMASSDKMDDTMSPQFLSDSSSVPSSDNLFEHQSSASSMSSFSDTEEFPRIALTIRLKETMAASELSEDLLADWIRAMPILAHHVRIEAGFSSFSTLLVLSLSIPLWCYIAVHPAISITGLVKSKNLVNKAYSKPTAVHKARDIIGVTLFRRPVIRGPRDIMRDRNARETKMRADEESRRKSVALSESSTLAASNTEDEFHEELRDLPIPAEGVISIQLPEHHEKDLANLSSDKNPLSWGLSTEKKRRSGLTTDYDKNAKTLTVPTRHSMTIYQYSGVHNNSRDHERSREDLLRRHNSLTLPQWSDIPLPLTLSENELASHNPRSLSQKLVLVNNAMPKDSQKQLKDPSAVRDSMGSLKITRSFSWRRAGSDSGYGSRRPSTFGSASEQADDEPLDLKVMEAKLDAEIEDWLKSCED